MSSNRPDPHPNPSQIWREPLDLLDQIPDSLLLLILNKIEDVKTLGRCCVVSRRLHSLVPQVDNVVVRVDCVISDDDTSSSGKPHNVFSIVYRFVYGSLVKPLQSFTSFLGSKRSNSSNSAAEAHLNDDNSGTSTSSSSSVAHHSPSQVLKNFNEIQTLRIELPNGELGIEDDVLLKWKADFGSSLDNCFILGASSVSSPPSVVSVSVVNNLEDNGSIPESFYTNGGLKLRVVWTISSLIAASARHYLLQPIIAEHHTLNNLVLTDADGQGMLCMNKEQLEELRVKPLAPSTASKTTLVPALNMRLWYAPHLELPNGVVLNGATLVAIRPSEQTSVKKDVSDGSWAAAAFGEPYGTAAKLLVKRRTYCLEMISF